MNADELKEWLTERDKAIASLDLDTFKKFYSKWQEKGAYRDSLPDDYSVELSIYKMAVDLPKISQEVKDKAMNWLKEHDSEPIDWGKQ